MSSAGTRRSGIYLASDDYDLQFHGNLIGTDVTGTLAIGNGESGIFIDRSTDASIGEGDAQTRNVISGNAVGITLHRTDNSSSVRGNYIGTDVSGTLAVPNGIGIVIDAATDERIGGFFEGDANVISGNTGDGIYVAGDGEDDIAADANDIWGNLIGTDATGTLPLGNGGNGITLDFATNDNNIDGNVIADNAGNGISIVTSYGNVIQDNFIGTDAGSTEALGNGLAGVRITGPSQGNQVGADHVGTAVSGPGNVIAHNGGNGVEVLQGTGDPGPDADFTSILSNAIWDNGGLGIDLEADGVTENDLGDDDDASNDLKNFPDDITAASDGFGTYGTHHDVLVGIGRDHHLPALCQRRVRPERERRGPALPRHVRHDRERRRLRRGRLLPLRGPRRPVPDRNGGRQPGTDVRVLRLLPRHLRLRRARSRDLPA